MVPVLKCKKNIELGGDPAKENASIESVAYIKHLEIVKKRVFRHENPSITYEVIFHSMNYLHTNISLLVFTNF